MAVRERVDHRFVDGKPVGIKTTVERLDYQGTVDGEPSYARSSREKWQAAAVTGWVLLAAVLAYFLIHLPH